MKAMKNTILSQTFAQCSIEASPKYSRESSTQSMALASNLINTAGFTAVISGGGGVSLIDLHQGLILANI